MRGGASGRTAASRPNFVVIFVDDRGWGDPSCFGNREVRTPHMDRLAAEGLRFRQFYVNSPICSPSRAALTTGQYPHRWRILSYLDSRAANERRGMAQWLDPRAPTLARYLHRAGYATGHFGKWHLGGQRDVADAPLITEYGFEETPTQFEGLGPRLLPLYDAHDGRPPRRHAPGSDRPGWFGPGTARVHEQRAPSRGPSQGCDTHGESRATRAAGCGTGRCPVFAARAPVGFPAAACRLSLWASAPATAHCATRGR